MQLCDNSMRIGVMTTLWQGGAAAPCIDGLHMSLTGFAKGPGAR